MKIHELDKQITLQIKSQVSDGMGGFIESYSDHATVWAAIWPTSSKDRISGQANGTITHRIRIRFRRNVTSDMRIKYGDRYFNIIGPPINPNEANQWLDILCEEAA